MVSKCYPADFSLGHGEDDGDGVLAGVVVPWIAEGNGIASIGRDVEIEVVVVFCWFADEAVVEFCGHFELFPANVWIFAIADILIALWQISGGVVEIAGNKTLNKMVEQDKTKNKPNEMR